MKKRLLALLLVVFMVATLLPMTALAAEEDATAPAPFEYTGDIPAFIKKDGSEFGMMRAVTGTTITLSEDGESIDIIYNANKGTTYKGFYLNASNDDKTTWSEDAFYASTDGNYSFRLSKEYCGKATPVVVIKAKDGTPAGDQYYLAIPAADKLPCYMPADDADVIVTISNNKGVLALARQTVTVKDINKDGKLSYDEALVAAHEKYCPGGYAQSSNWVTKLWGVDGASCGFYLNDVSIPNGVETDAVAAGDELTAFMYSDTSGWSDAYTYFTEKEARAAVGEDFEMTAKATSWGIGDDPVAAAGLKIGTWSEGTFTAIEGAVTDADGKVTFKFDKAGTYTISAEGPVTAGGKSYPASAPVCTVKVVDVVTADITVSVSNEGVLALARQKVSVTDIDKDGILTYYEALVAAHEAYCPAGTAGLELMSSGMVKSLWGVQAGGNCLFFLNNAFIPKGVTEDTVKDGDDIVAAIMSDVDEYYYTDYYAYFTKSEKKVSAGENFDLTIALVPNEMMGLEEASPEGLQAGTWADGEFTAIDGAVADESGKVTLSFAEPGTYIVSAGGTVYFEDWDMDCPIVAPVCVVTVREAGAPLGLKITNNTGMFKADSAFLETKDGKTELVMALSGTGYHYLYKGTYEQAVANGDNRDNWIEGKTNADGKLEFRIPVEDGESYIPVVAVSQNYLDKYEKGENVLARAFYPRQLEIDADAGTLVTGDYENTQELEVTNNVKMFKVASAALETVGGPNSNNYKSSLILTMGSDSFSKAFVGYADEAAEATETIAIGEGLTFDIPVRWVEKFGYPETMQSLIGETFIMSFYSVSKSAWYERKFTISEEDGTLVIDEAIKADDAVVYLTVSNEGKLAAARAEVTVKDINRDGVLSLDEALIAAHEEYCPDGYERAPGSYGLFVSKVWGVANGGSYLFYINDKGIASDVGTDTVKDGDEVTAAILKDVTGYSDIYTYFTEKALEIEPGGSVDLTLMASSWNLGEEPVAGAGLTVGTWKDGTFTALEGMTTDADGKVKLTFDEPGIYVISADGTMKATVYDYYTGTSEEKDCPIIAPMCVVTAEGAPAFKTQSLVLSGEIGVNFYMDLSQLAEETRSASYVEFTVGKGNPVKAAFDANKTNSKGYFGFTCYVRSIEMADTITAVYHYGDGKTVSKEYSVVKYIQAIEKNASNYSAEMVALAHAIADYGHYAQPYLADVNGWTVGDKFAEMTLHFTDEYDYADILSKVQANAFAKAIDGSTITKASYKLHLDTDTVLDVLLTTSDGAAPTDVTVTTHDEETGKETTVKATPELDNQGRYLIRITGISAHRLGNMMTITGTAGTKFTIEVSPLSFVRSILNNASQTKEAKDCVSALYAYYAATMDYRNR